MYEDDPQDRVFDVLGEARVRHTPARAPGDRPRRGDRGRHARAAAPPSTPRATARERRDRGGRLGRPRRARRARGRAASAARAGGGRPRASGAARTRRRRRFATGHRAALRVRQGHRAVPRVPRRVRASRATTSAASRCACSKAMLGGTSSSRLFQEVRERRGLAYSVFSFSNLYAHAGEVGLYVGTRPDNLAEALAVVRPELERCVERPGQRGGAVALAREPQGPRACSSLESTGARMSRLGSSLLARRCRSCPSTR